MGEFNNADSKLLITKVKSWGGRILMVCYLGNGFKVHVMSLPEKQAINVE